MLQRRNRSTFHNKQVFIEEDVREEAHGSQHLLCAVTVSGGRTRRDTSQLASPQSLFFGGEAQEQTSSVKNNTPRLQSRTLLHRSKPHLVVWGLASEQTYILNFFSKSFLKSSFGATIQFFLFYLPRVQKGSRQSPSLLPCQKERGTALNQNRAFKRRGENQIVLHEGPYPGCRKTERVRLNTQSFLSTQNTDKGLSSTKVNNCQQRPGISAGRSSSCNLECKVPLSSQRVSIQAQDGTVKCIYRLLLSLIPVHSLIYTCRPKKGFSQLRF